MKFSVGLGRNTTCAKMAAEAKVAEETGFSYITVVDQQHVDRDVYMLMMACAMNTKTIMIGQGVTVPYTRHPSVTANATATLNDLSGGRAFLGIGSGGFIVRGLDEFRQIVDFIKGYISGREVEFEGVRMHSGWIKDRFPIYLAANGPKSLRLAGEIADGVIAIGGNPELVKWRLELIEEGARASGRSLSDIDVWIRVGMCISEDEATIHKMVASYSPRVPWHVMRNKGPEIDDLRRRLAAKVPESEAIIADSRAANKAWNWYEHETATGRYTQFVTPRLMNFIHLVGSEEHIRERIHELRGLGVRHISITMFPFDNREPVMEEIGAKIIRSFQ